MGSKLKHSIGKLSKAKEIEATVIDVVGNRISVRLSSNGKVLHGIPFTGGPVMPGKQVFVDYSSGQPKAHCPGETAEVSTQPTVSSRGVVTEFPQTEIGGTDGVGNVPDHSHPSEETLIQVFGTDGSLSVFAATSAGLDEALAAAGAGSVVRLPPCTISGDHTVPANVTLIGSGQYTCFLTGKITLNAGCEMDALYINRNAASASALIGLALPATGIVGIVNTIVVVQNTGTGGASAVQVPDGNLKVGFGQCWLKSETAAGASVAITVGAAFNFVDGWIKLRHTSVQAYGPAGMCDNFTSNGVLTYAVDMEMSFAHVGTLDEGDLINRIPPGPHTHNEIDITDLSHDAVRIQGADIPAPLAGNDGQAVVYNAGTGEFEYQTIAGGHNPVTVLDSPTVDLALVGQEIQASVIPGGIKLDDLGVPDDNIDLNVSTARHGLAPKLDNDPLHFLNGQGGWTAPPGGAGGSGLDVFTELITEEACGDLGVNLGQIHNSLASISISGTVYQVVIFWDKNRKLVIGKRVLNGAWTLYTYNGTGGLPNIALSTEDHHNYSSIGIDSAGYLHFSYDMHAQALNYRRSTGPVSTWTGAVTAEGPMLGTNEAQVTYPAFFRAPDGRLFFLFRNGGSGSGDYYSYVYNTATQTWSALAGLGVGGKTLDGINQTPDQNPYINYPSFDANFGSGGFMHLSWHWRNSVNNDLAHGCDTNNNVGYVKWDGTNWFKADGTPQVMPILLSNQETVDPVPVTTGMTSFNSVYSDSLGHPHIVYPKTGTDGYRHIYHAHHNGVNWTVTQVSKTKALPTTDLWNSAFGNTLIRIDRTRDVAYIFCEDNSDAPGVTVYASQPGDFTSWRRWVIYPETVGRWRSNIDYDEFERSGDFYLFLPSWKDDRQVGETIQTGFEAQLPIRIMRWQDYNQKQPRFQYKDGTADESSSVGHAIYDYDLPLTQREGLEFQGLVVTDDPVTGRTIVALDTSGELPVSTTKETLEVRKVLYDVTLDANATQFDIQNIDQSYTHLQLVLTNARTDQVATHTPIVIAFNADAVDSNYRAQSIYANGAAASATQSDARNICNVSAGSAPASSVGQAIVDILSYAGNKKKLYSSRAVWRTTSTGIYNYLISAEWENTSAISRITVSVGEVSNLLPGTRLQLVGLKLMNVVTEVTGGVPGGGGHVIEEEGVPLTQRANLNFVGDSVTVTDDAVNDRTIVTVEGGTGGGHTIQDEGVGLAQRTNLNFVGFTVTDDVANDRTTVEAPEAAAGAPLTVTKKMIQTETVIFDQTLAIDGQFDVNNIPQTYDHLKILISDARSASAAVNSGIRMWVNEDLTATNYRFSAHRVSAASHANSSGNWPMVGHGPGTTQNAAFSSDIYIDLPNFSRSGTVMKDAYSRESFRYDSVTQFQESWLFSWVWQASSAITRLRFDMVETGNNFRVGTRLQVIAVKTEEVVTDVVGAAGGEIPHLAIAENAASPLVTPSSDGSGQMIHPSVIYVEAGLNGYKYWKAATPFPAGDASKENPEVLASNDGTTWVVPAGLTNPIDPTPPDGHNADTELLLGQDGVMYCYYIDEVGSGAHLHVRSSNDGVIWGNEQTLLSQPSQQIASPCVLWDGNQYVFWYVDVSVNPRVLRKRTCSTPNGTLSAPSNCTVNGIPSGQRLWHLSIYRYNGAYHAFVTMELSGHDLYFAISYDGDIWTLNSTPLLVPGPAGNWDDGFLYRASAVPTDYGYDLFYSANSDPTNWVIARTGRTSVYLLDLNGPIYQISAGTGLTGGTITVTGEIALADTAVTPGTYVNASIAVDQQGRITAAADGSSSGGSGESLVANNTTPLAMLTNEAEDDYLFEG